MLLLRDDEADRFGGGRGLAEEGEESDEAGHCRHDEVEEVGRREPDDACRAVDGGG
jgi:hypothetical protein